MEHGDHDDLELRELEEIDAEMSSSAREASMGFGTLLEMGAAPAPAIFAEAWRQRADRGGPSTPPRY